MNERQRVARRSGSQDAHTLLHNVSPRQYLVLHFPQVHDQHNSDDSTLQFDGSEEIAIHYILLTTRTAEKKCHRCEVLATIYFTPFSFLTSTLFLISSNTFYEVEL